MLTTQISKLGLIAMGETRDVCARLFAASLLSLQEIPKGNAVSYTHLTLPTICSV